MNVLDVPQRGSGMLSRLHLKIRLDVQCREMRLQVVRSAFENEDGIQRRVTRRCGVDEIKTPKKAGTAVTAEIGGEGQIVGERVGRTSSYWSKNDAERKSLKPVETRIVASRGRNVLFQTLKSNLKF